MLGIWAREPAPSRLQFQGEGGGPDNPAGQEGGHLNSGTVWLTTAETTKVPLWAPFGPKFVKNTKQNCRKAPEGNFLTFLGVPETPPKVGPPWQTGEGVVHTSPSGPEEGWDTPHLNPMCPP